MLSFLGELQKNPKCSTCVIMQLIVTVRNNPDTMYFYASMLTNLVGKMKS